MVRTVIVSLVTLATAACVPQSTPEIPRIWNERDLKNWATPVAQLNVRPAHYSEAEYYAATAENLRSYPVFHPEKEPPGYWETLQRKKPERLVDATTIRTERDWITAGERAFRELDVVLGRTADPAMIARARDPTAFEGVVTLADGSVVEPRWVVTERGVMLSGGACTSCHAQVRPDRTILLGGAPGPLPGGTRMTPRGLGGATFGILAARNRFPGDTLSLIAWRGWTVPWAPDPRVERIRALTEEGLLTLVQAGILGTPGVFPRVNASPYHTTRVPDLHALRYSRYLDATGTHRLRGAEDVARYAALVSDADAMTFGPHRLLDDERRPLKFRYADEVLYAIGQYLMSLQPPSNPVPQPRTLVERGRNVFERERCARCHQPPAYTTGKLTLAEGYTPSADHPNRGDIMSRSVGTDPGLAISTRKGTGFYKIPSLRGVWSRPRLLHDGSLGSLEEMFDVSRLSSDHVPGGWPGVGISRRAIPGHRYGLELNAEDRVALLAFLRTL